MYIQKRFTFKSMLVWTKRELIFFTIIATGFTVLYEFLDIKWLQVPLAPVTLVGTAVAFMLGFQNNAAYDRAWEARKIWGGIVNTSRTLIITIRDSFYLHRNEASKDESETLRVITHRHIAWLTTLRYAMRTKKQWEASYGTYSGKSKFAYHIPELEEPLEGQLKPYLSDEEYAYVMTIDNKPNAIISLQSKHLRILNSEKKFWDFSLLKFQGMLEELTALQGKSERLKNFPYPKQYASVAYHFVHLFRWLLPMAIIPTFAALGVTISETHPTIGEFFIWLNIPITVIVTWVFNTLLRLGMAGENPFEGSVNDVPISNISRGITRDILQLIDEDPENIPAQFESVNNVDM